MIPRARHHRGEDEQGNHCNDLGLVWRFLNQYEKAEAELAERPLTTDGNDNMPALKPSARRLRWRKRNQADYGCNHRLK